MMKTHSKADEDNLTISWLHNLKSDEICVTITKVHILKIAKDCATIRVPILNSNATIAHMHKVRSDDSNITKIGIDNHNSDNGSISTAKNVCF